MTGSAGSGTRRSALAMAQSAAGRRRDHRAHRAGRSSSSRSRRSATRPARRWPRSAAPASSSPRCATRCSRRGRLRRALAQGPAHRRRRGPHAGRRAAPRGPARRARGPRRPDAGRAARRGPVGTGSPRRTAQLRALGYGLEVVPVRGNVDTRLRLVADGEVDAVVLAARRAGPPRAPRGGHRGHRPPPDASRPRPGGAGRSSAAHRRTRTPARSPPCSPCSTTRDPARRDRRALPARRPGGRLLRPRGASATLADGEHVTELHLRARRQCRRRLGLRAAVRRPDPPRRGCRRIGRELAAADARRGCGRSDGGASPVTSPNPSRKPSQLARAGRSAASPSSVPAPATRSADAPRRRGARQGRRRSSTESHATRRSSRRFCRDDVEVVDGSLGDDGQPLSRRAGPARRQGRQARRQRGRLLDGDPCLDATGAEEVLGLRQGADPLRGRAGRRRRRPPCPPTRACRCARPRHRDVRFVDGRRPRRSGLVDPARRRRPPWCCSSATAATGDAAKALVAAGRKPDDAGRDHPAGTTTDAAHL